MSDELRNEGVTHELVHRSQTRRPLVVFLGGVLFASVGFIIWPGCASAPLTITRKPVSTLDSKQVTSLNGHPLTRDEVEGRLGKPDEYFADVRVACYPLNHLNRRRLLLLLGVVPFGTYPDQLGGEVAMIQFDELGKLQRVAIQKQFPYSGTFRQSVQKWTGAKTPAANSR